MLRILIRNSNSNELKKIVEKYSNKNRKFRPGVGKLRPAKVKSAAREHVTFLNGMRPASM